MWDVSKLKNYLKKVHIDEDYIIIHSDITGLVFPKFSLSKLWKLIYESFGKNKTYIFPAFRFSDNKKYWHYNSTKSESGILSEYFRKKKSSIRTIHPIHSVSIFGKSTHKIPFKHCSTSFGKNSFWEWACNNKNVCNISLGLELDGGATFCHYPEEFCNVPYRSLIDIDCKIISKNNRIIKKKFSYFARQKKTNQEFINNWKYINKLLIKKKINNKVFFPINFNNYGNLVSTSIPVLLKENMKKFKKEKKILICGFGVGLSAAITLLHR